VVQGNRCGAAVRALQPASERHAGATANAKTPYAWVTSPGGRVIKRAPVRWASWAP
jgi:hypothetical protein